MTDVSPNDSAFRRALRRRSPEVLSLVAFFLGA
ncbi:MAG: hypothetical protein QOC64_3827, partial [Solirubrobacteraceae bacterium]|nr:hypothetical protein [Solirubrobacteraceae bacterium]